MTSFMDDPLIPSETLLKLLEKQANPPEEILLRKWIELVFFGTGLMQLKNL